MASPQITWWPQTIRGRECTSVVGFRVRAMISRGVASGDEGKGKLGAHAMKRVAAGVHLPTPRLFELAKRPDDRADYCLDERIYRPPNAHGIFGFIRMFIFRLFRKKCVRTEFKRFSRGILPPLREIYAYNIGRVLKQQGCDLPQG